MRKRKQGRKSKKVIECTCEVCGTKFQLTNKGGYLWKTSVNRKTKYLCSYKCFDILCEEKKAQKELRQMKVKNEGVTSGSYADYQKVKAKIVDYILKGMHFIQYNGWVRVIETKENFNGIPEILMIKLKGEAHERELIN